MSAPSWAIPTSPDYNSVMAAVRGFQNRDRVQYVGVTGHADGPTGRVIREYRSGVRVRWDDNGVQETVHPDSLRVIS
ncbi:hypothetical protein [Gordonia iterans]